MKKLISSKNKLVKGIPFILSILIISISCTKTMDNMYGSGGNTGGAGNKSGPGTNEVWIQGMAFSPNTITITAGTSITWTNKDAVSHTVTSNTALFDSGALPTNGTFTYMFGTAGTYSYKCSIHPSMTASVVVK